MLVFWEKGFNATSMQDLLEHMGISRQSLYNTFGDKRKLFHAALDHYKRKRALELWATLRRPDAGVEEIREVFEKILQSVGTGGPRACMFGASCMEQGLFDELVAGRAREAFDDIEALIERAIENAKARGEVGADVRAKATARHLINTIQGLGVLLRSGADPDRARDVVCVALSVLR